MNCLIIPHIRIQNANALSSPYTVGFPAVTAWLGAVHALERRLYGVLQGVAFTSVGIVAHDCNLHTYRGPGDFMSSIVGTANPLDEKGERPSFIEEARIHLEVSLVIELSGGFRESMRNSLPAVVSKRFSRMKLAGGDILGFKAPRIVTVNQPVELLRILGPVYALIERRDLMQEAMQAGTDALDALIDLLAVHHRCEEAGDEIQWETSRAQEGWVVPVAIGFFGISDLGKAKNQRDPDTPHRFAESVVTVGEFKMPHRLPNLDEMLWEYRYDEDASLYLCETKTTNKE